MAQLSAEHRKYVTGETVVSTVINTILSVVFAFLAAGGQDRVPLWGGRGMAVDFVPTVFMITLVTTIAVTLITRKRMRAGKVAPLPAGEGGPLAWAPRNAFARGFTYASLAAAVLVPLSIGVLHLLRVDELPLMTFVAFKAVYGAVLSLLITPPIVRAALASG